MDLTPEINAERLYAVNCQNPEASGHKLQFNIDRKEDTRVDEMETTSSATSVPKVFSASDPNEQLAQSGEAPQSIVGDKYIKPDSPSVEKCNSFCISPEAPFGSSQKISCDQNHRPLGCKFCVKSFRYASSLRRHERSHTGDRPYVCNICNKGFIQTSHLRTHELIHAKEHSFPCHFCDKKFTQFFKLQRHKSSVHS